MRLHILSDLHLERRGSMPLGPPAPEADVTILSGDIARGVDGVRWARERGGGRPVLYVAGNHEFYGHSLPGLVCELRAEAAGSSVQVLEDDAVVLGGVRFLGCTLWSDFELGGIEERERSMALGARLVNDYAHIQWDGDGGRGLTPQDTRAVHTSSREWLSRQLGQAHDGPTVVITHHAPLVRGRPEKSLWRAVAGSFASDLSHLMGADRAVLWIYGHTHRAADTDVRGTRVLSNPRGYAEKPVREFDPALVIELG
jgi:predicted phosphodiesterase